LYSKSTIKEITDLAGEHDLFLVSDEIYDKLVYEDKCVSPAAVSKDIPVVVLNGVSKVFLAPGWRVGYMAFRDVDEKMEEIKEFVLKQARTRVSASRPAQLAYAAALRSRHDFVSATIKKMKERRDYAVKRINEIDGLSTQTPGGAFYTFPKIDCQNDKKWVLDLLQKKHVLVVHGSGFSQDYGKGHFRMVFLPPVDVLDEAFDRIEEFMKGD
jgi:aspartate/methionine/tyrosine aminotransferase